MKQHKQIHTEIDGEYGCSQCSKLFKTTTKLKRHELRVHSLGFVCDLCNYSTGSSYNLKRHLATHKFEGRSFEPPDEISENFQEKSSLEIEFLIEER